jgi:methionyl-tRNA synthetase
MNHIWQEIGELDALIQEKEPFKLIKTDQEKGKELIGELVEKLAHIAHSLKAFLPETSEKILSCISDNKMPEESLFKRIEA